MDEIQQLIHGLGIHSTYLGYRYLYYAVMLVLEKEDYLLAITKTLYPSVAKKYHTNSFSVERNIRTVIGVCWDRGNRELLKQIASYPLLDKPTTGEFIDIIVSYCKKSHLRK